MIILRVFCMICALTCGLTDLLSSHESRNREWRYSDQQPEYNLFYGNKYNKSQEEEFYIPQGYKLGRESPYNVDFWKVRNSAFVRDQDYYETDHLVENYSPLREYETINPNISKPGVVVFTTKGKGKAIVRRRGETVYVPNELGHRRAHKSTISVRVADRNGNDFKMNKYRSGCRECPSDQTVVAPKGTSFALLPEPCPPAPKMWNHISGPKPGSKIQEGMHVIRGRIGPKKKYCEYRYQLLVNRCEPLKVKEESEIIECSAENAWGSICIISCGEDKEPTGPTELECNSDLTWSNPLPTCKSKTDCQISKIKAKSKISCQKANMSHTGNDHLPNGSTCTFRQNGREISITCKDGKWLKSRKNKTLWPKQNAQDGKQTISKKDPCNPNPCQNGGTCLTSESRTGTSICKCRPQTHGAQCELRECYYNICENEGLCIYNNEQRTCYCSSEYGGDRCQNYKNI